MEKIPLTKHGQTALSVFARACIFAIEQPINLVGHTVQVGTSLGISAGSDIDLPPSTLLGPADSTLYRAKSIPGSSFEFAGDTSSDLAA